MIFLRKFKFSFTKFFVYGINLTITQIQDPLKNKCNLDFV